MCVIQLTVDLYILYNLCSIFKRMGLEIELWTKGIAATDGMGWTET